MDPAPTSFLLPDPPCTGCMAPVFRLRPGSAPSSGRLRLQARFGPVTAPEPVLLGPGQALRPRFGWSHGHGENAGHRPARAGGGSTCPRRPRQTGRAADRGDPVNLKRLARRLANRPANGRPNGRPLWSNGRPLWSNGRPLWSNGWPWWPPRTHNSRWLPAGT